MKLKALLTDDDAVSPVIGVILMVAITVILAAVIGTFVLGLGNQVGNNAPQASFSTDFTDSATAQDDQLAVTHNGGAQITASQLEFKSTGQIDGTKSGTDETTTTSLTWANAGGTGASTSDVSAGDTANVYADSDNSNGLNDDTVRLIWTSAGGDSSAELAKWTGPDA